MKYKIQKIDLTEDEEIWLNKVYELEKEGRDYNYRELRVQLYNEISKNFNPKQIDSAWPKSM